MFDFAITEPYDQPGSPTKKFLQLIEIKVIYIYELHNTVYQMVLGGTTFVSKEVCEIMTKSKGAYNAIFFN
jgi:hypothetical protein